MDKSQTGQNPMLRQCVDDGQETQGREPESRLTANNLAARYMEDSKTTSAELMVPSLEKEQIWISNSPDQGENEAVEKLSFPSLSYPVLEKKFDSGQNTLEMATQEIAPEIPTAKVKEFFGSSFPAVEYFGKMLQDEGELRGLIGPRELPRIWSRHLLNCAAVEQFIPAGRDITVADVGSGAGLPGIVLACMRPEVSFYLIEPMERRIHWLQDVIAEMDLDNVQLIHGRSQDLPRKVKFDCVTSRAVANLTKLVNMSAKLVAGGGKMLALKGQKAQAEIEAAKYALKKAGLINTRVEQVPNLMDDSPTRIVIATKKK